MSNFHANLDNLFFRDSADGEFIRKVLTEKFAIFGAQMRFWYTPRHYARVKPPYTRGSAVYDEPRTPPDHIVHDEVVNEWDFTGPFDVWGVVRAIEDVDEPDDKGAQSSEPRTIWFLRYEIEDAGAGELFEGDIIQYGDWYYDVNGVNRDGWMNPGTFFLFNAELNRRTKYLPERRIPEDQR